MPTHPIVAPKKLIEVALPLEAINVASIRENYIYRGNPSAVHKWWAQRPLAAARAVLFAQMVNDPSWKHSDDELRRPQVRASIKRRRNDLFRLITELVQWESTTDERVLRKARSELAASWRETCEANRSHPDARSLFDATVLPPFADPFAGGGTLPLEAQRLGLVSHASDLNPVAVLIASSLVDVPARFVGKRPIGPLPPAQMQTNAEATEDWSGARGLAEDVRRYGTWMRQEAWTRIGHLYPRVRLTRALVRTRPDLSQFEGKEVLVIAWLWARTVASPNPAAYGSEVPIASSFLLSKKHDAAVWVEPVTRGRLFRFKLHVGDPGSRRAELELGTRAGKAQAFKCLFTGAPISRDYVQKEGKAGRLGARLMAVVVETPAGRVYLPAEVAPVSLTPEEIERAREARRTFLSGSTPTRAMVTGGVCSAYGLTTWGSLYTDRQLISLMTFSDLLDEVRDRVMRDALRSGYSGDHASGEERGLNESGTGARAFGEAVALYLAFSIDKTAEYGCTLVPWYSKEDRPKGLFARQAIPMVFDYAETNPFSEIGGSLRSSTTIVAGALGGYPASCPGGESLQLSAMEWAAPRPTAVISTDPPYYDNIAYAELSDFFYVWLRRSLRSTYPDLLATIATPKEEELVATRSKRSTKGDSDAAFLEGMTRVLTRVSGTTLGAFPVTIYYAFKQSDTADGATVSSGWESFLDAVIRSGFAITGTWPIRTERGARATAKDANALASSIVLVCRPRGDDAVTIARKDFLRELDRTIPSAISEMTADPVASIAPVDLAQACIGPGIALFSKRRAVLEADGAPMAVRAALVHINKAIDDYFAEAEGDLDADTRFCIGWFQQYGFDTGPFGDADVLARAKGTAVDGVDEAGVLSATKGKVRLLRVKDYPKKWDPRNDSRVSVWEACHQMCRALGESEHDAGELLARMPEKEDAIRQLAYRLYTICERQKWAEEARAYNELITSWPAIVDESHKVGHKGTQLDLL